ncbi:hypothetical protein DENSPDRAFT_621802 [Dentipellis sp. KUC8613]|nr:hypothetical protein DENSPDRAFT_621802 [Dentipellis sp. KUC8613]
MSLPPSEVLLGSLFIEGFAYGICTALGIIALIINTRNREKRERVHVLIFSLLLFALVVATAHIALACVQVLIVFVKKADGVPLGSLVHSVTTSNRLFVARMALHMIQMSLIDGLVVRSSLILAFCLSHVSKVWLFFVNFDRRKQSKVFLAATWSIILGR